MITAIDTNILLDVILPGAPHKDQSLQSLAEANNAGALVISEPVLAELSSRFQREDEIGAFMNETAVRLQPSSRAALFQAGRAWREYLARRPQSIECPNCGAGNSVRCEGCGESVQVRQHVLADLLIGAHAMHHADRLLTRDRGFYRTYFPSLVLSG